MTTIVTLRVQGLDFENADLACEIQEKWDAELVRENGLVLLEIYIDNDSDVVCATTDMVKQIEQLVPGFKADSVYKDLVSMSDIADRVGLSKEAVRKWILNNELNFPDQVSSIGNGQKIWDWVDVSGWLLDVKKLDMDENLPTRNQILQIDACLAGVPDKTQLDWSRIENRDNVITQVLTQEVTKPTHLSVVRLPRTEVFFHEVVDGERYARTN